MYGYVIFTDIEKYSTLQDADLKIYFNKIIPVIYEELKVYKESAIIWNTWGDAIFAIYDKAETAINMALAYREAFNKLDFEKFGIKKLNPRIAGNFGEFELIYDPVSGKSNVHGTLVNLTARIEPVTAPGEIFVTKEFKDMAISSYDKVDNVRFEDMGITELSKNAGTMYLYRLCRRTEDMFKPLGNVVFPVLNYNIQNLSEEESIFSIEQPESTNTNSKTESVKQSVKKEFKKEEFAETKFIKEDVTENKLKKEVFVGKPSNNKGFSVNKFKKTLNSLNLQKIFIKNPFGLAIIIFTVSIFVNYLLELYFTKNLFNWFGYYLNLSLNWLNINLHIKLFTNTLILQFLDIMNPWMWLRGFAISTFFISENLTLKDSEIMKSKTIYATVLIIGLFQFILYVSPYGFLLFPASIIFITFLIQNFYVKVLILMVVCLVGILFGKENALSEKKVILKPTQPQ